ncbi:hypothetical protein REPUB_Repub16aG0136200 [Reevesia pubescens]
MMEELGFDMSNVVEEVKDDAGIDFKDFKTVETACLNFGKDRFDILRSLLRQDILNLVGFGCPSTDKKVVFSAKLLRKHVHHDEGDKPPPKVKQPPKKKKRVGRDDIEMKEGDWLCPKYDFMNFASGQRDSCSLGNGNAQKVSNAWNFDFDDNESDGADVAAFEYADSSVKGEASPLDNQTRGGKFRGLEDDLDRAGPASKVHERKHSDIDSSTHGNGFNDFDDEDDIDSYEIDSKRSNPRQKASSNIYSDNEAFSEPEGSEGSNDSSLARLRTRVPSYSKPAKHMHRKVALSDSEDELDFDSDEELSVHPNWKSSHVADSKLRGRGARGVSKNLSCVSEDMIWIPIVMMILTVLDPNEGKRTNRITAKAISREEEGLIFKVVPSLVQTMKMVVHNPGEMCQEGIISRGSLGDNRRFREDDYGRQRMNNMQKFKGPKKDGGFGDGRHGKSHEYSMEMDDPSEFKNSRRVIER